MDEIIHHLAVFISGLWQIHVFGEGNIRTSAVFFIKYLRTLGFDVTNDVFAKNAWYFRNSPVRANYNDLKNCIHETTEFPELFLRNLLLNEDHPLHNRTLHISGAFKEAERVNIGDQKANIEKGKVNIENSFTAKTASHVCKLPEAFGFRTIFGRSDIQEVLELKPTGCTALPKEMAEKGFIESVSGLGKGKYRFRGYSGDQVTGQIRCQADKHHIKSLEIKGFLGYCQNQVHCRSPVITSGSSQTCVLHVLGVP